MATNTAAISALLRPGLDAVFGSFDPYDNQWAEIFKVHNSNMQQEFDWEMKFLGLPQIKPEGAPIAVDTLGQRIQNTYIHKVIAISAVLTMEAIDDNLYKARFPLIAKSMKNSMATAKNILGASIINNGYDGTNYPLGDGQPLFSTQHPIDTGVYANTPAVPADLTEASLEAACIAIQGFKDQAGILCQARAQKLIVPPDGQFVADRILNSTFRPGTANNDINSLNHQGMIPQGFKVNNFFTMPRSWVVLTSMNADNGFKHFKRKPLTTNMYTDPSTYNIMFSAMERYSFGVSNPRAAYGSPGA